MSTGQRSRGWPPPNVEQWSPWPTISRLSVSQQEDRLWHIARWQRTGEPLLHRGPGGDIVGWVSPRTPQ
jgi:hypothetical protein